MAVPAAGGTLLVRLCPAPDGGEKAMLKLQSYFQSPKRSGGGECEVRAGPEPDTYWVYFQHERDKKRVESRADHVLELGGKALKVVLQPLEGARSKSPATVRADRGRAQHFSPPGCAELRAAQEHRNGAAEVLTRKIFLTVSAVLNTSMFTEQQREKIATVCPNLRREGNPDVDGSEKLTGDYADIEKAYCYFKDVLAGNDQHYDFLRSDSKKILEDEKGLNTKEMNTLTVPSAIYEYFCHTCKEQIKEMHKRFGVCVKSKDCYNGNTSISFLSDTSPTSIRRAIDFFTSAFQKAAKDVAQEDIPVANSYQLDETIMKLNAKFTNLLIKQKDNQLLLRGPRNDILAAKIFLAEEKAENNQDEKDTKIPELTTYRNRIEVDASVFKLLAPVLRKEIEDIEGSFDVVIEKVDSSGGQKMLLIFKPRNKTSDMLLHSIESFINGFQNAFAMLREKLISWKLSEHQKRKLNMLLDEKQLESLYVKLKKKEDKLILYGLPNHVRAAEKHIMYLLNAEEPSETKKRTPLSSDLNNQEASGAREEYGAREKSNYSSMEQAKAKTEDTDDTCPICMEKINDKEILTKCKHVFCKSCIKMALEYKQTCPVCNTVYGVMQGDQPEGRMYFKRISAALPGYPGYGTIEIEYVMESGIQTQNHPNPGKPYYGIIRKAYLPDSEEGVEVLQLLRRAFNQKLIFTVGNSRTTGAEDVITWNDIHHKTSMYGGPMNFGYPDPDYLKRVRSELKARGIE